MARQTLTMLGPDTDVNQLLASAEVEHAARETRSGQEKKLGKVRTLLRLGRLDAAAAALDELIKSGDFDALDPRLYEVAEEIESARTSLNATTCTIVTGEPAAPAREYAMI